MKRLRGIDVSTYQGVLTDAIVAALIDEGCAFAYVRAAVGTGSRPDDRLVHNIALFKSYGLACGPYFFPYPLPHLDPEVQAELHMSVAEGLGSNVGDLAPMIDAEWPPRETRLKDGTLEQTWAKWGCTDAQIRSWLLRYGRRVDALTGCTCPFYSYRYWLKCVRPELEPEFGLRPLVLADYSWSGRVPDDEACAKLSVPAPWKKVTIWQHDGDGGLRLPAGGADVDWSVMPDPADLDALRGMTRAIPPLPAIDLTAAQHEGMGIMLDEMIAEYRRTRIDEAV